MTQQKSRPSRRGLKIVSTASLVGYCHCKRAHVIFRFITVFVLSIIMPACVVKWCRSHTRIKCPGITFHYFPADAIRKKKWIAAVKLERQEYDWRPVKTSRVCSIHFDEKDFYKSSKGYTMLHKTAVPVCTMIRLAETPTSSRNSTENENSTNEILQSVDENSLSANFKVCDLPEQLTKTNTTEAQANKAQKRKLNIRDNFPMIEYSNTGEGLKIEPVEDRGQSDTANGEQPSIYPEKRSRKRLSETSIDKAASDENITEDDEFDLFCKSLALQLKKMPLHHALVCQQKLQSVMVQERLQFMTVEALQSYKSAHSSQSPPCYNSPEFNNDDGQKNSPQYHSEITIKTELSPIHENDTS